MRGEVEVWSGDDLILKEANMLTDGAGELLADIMTVSPSLATIADPATQAILDASNYTIQAISFGTGPDAFRSNAHAKDDDWEALYGLVSGSIYDYESLSRSANVALLQTNRGDKNESSTNQPVDAGFPTPPDPEKTKLEEDTNLSSLVSYSEQEISISSVVPGNGQLTNFLPFLNMSSTLSSTELSGPNIIQAASLLGCFPEGVSVSYPVGNKNRVFYKDGRTLGTQVQISTGSYFNEVGSMDVSGFVNKVSGSNSTLGLTVSSNASFASNGTVEYAVTLSKDDALFAHAYGGIFHLGMWTIDMKESLLNGNTPPFAFSVLNNPRKYRLFCRKGVSKDLTYIEDITAYQDLTIKWRLHFL